MDRLAVECRDEGARAKARSLAVSPESLGEGSAAQQEVAAQPEARLLLAFHRLRRGSAYSRRLAHRPSAGRRRH